MIDESASIAEFVSDWNLNTRVVQVTSNAPFRILGANPERVGICWWPSTVGSYNVGPDINLSSINGWQINAQTPENPFLYERWGAIISLAWYAQFNFLGSYVVSEIIYRPIVRE